MPNTDNLVPVFREIVGGANMVTDPDKLRASTVDGIVPGVMVSPGTIEETSKVMAAAHERGLSVIPTGGGTKMSLGGIARKADLLLSTRRMKSYADYDIANLSIEVECGATVSDVQAGLKAEGEGYFLPLDPPHSKGATIGGVVATNDNGPRRLLYGGLRDIILGNTAVLPNGDIIKSGGKCMKNVASYDLTKLLIGSMGSLGLICRTTFRIYLKPESEATLFLSFNDLQSADRFLRKVIQSFYYPAAIELMTAKTMEGHRNMIPLDADYIVAVGLEGIVEAVERQIKDLTEIGRRDGAIGTVSVQGEGHLGFWIAYRDFTEELAKTHPDLICLKSNFIISRCMEMIAASEGAVREAGLACALACHAGNGILYTAIWAGQDWTAKTAAVVETIEKLTAEAVKNEGNLVVEVAPLFIKEKVSVWGRTGQDISLVRGLKEKFDPAGIMNPGRYVGGI
ncbi:MAG: FAD-binding oxidoreductase [Deltaproteobacteria bacterium]|nr:FAD-binding oxidoreductase [Deltaproteobacteria bacterium]